MRASFVACLVALAVMVGCRSVIGPAVTGFEQDGRALTQYHRPPPSTPWLYSNYNANPYYPPLRSAEFRRVGDRIVIRATFERPPEPLEYSPNAPGPGGAASGWWVGLHVGRLRPGIDFDALVVSSREGSPTVVTYSYDGTFGTVLGPATIRLKGTVVEASFDAALLPFEPTEVGVYAESPVDLWSFWRVPVGRALSGNGGRPQEDEPRL